MIETRTERIIAQHPRGWGELVTYGKTVEEVKEEIDLSNIKADLKGYSPTTWLIVREETYTRWDDTGEFLERTTTRKAIEKYPV